MAEAEDSPASSTDDKPFFAIDAEDVAEATAAATATTTASSSATPQPPQPMMLGTLNNPSTPSSLDPPSGAASDMSANPWGAPTPQLTGAINQVQGQGMFAVPAPNEEKGFRWGQFFIGVGAPLFVFIVIGLIGAALEPSWDDAYRFEEPILSSEDGSYFQHQLELSDNEYVTVFSAYFEDDGDSIYLNSGWADDDEDDGRAFTIYQDSPDRFVAIGQYYPSNQTLSFTLSETSTDRLECFVEYTDVDFEEQQERATDFINAMLCFAPLAFIIGTIAAFVKGNRALGYGLITSLFVGFVVLPVLFIGLLIVAFSSV